jgi:ectoine hydroxylase-related dioxygenase (phytanoyl-CoA dioxygenase family)
LYDKQIFKYKICIFLLY